MRASKLFRVKAIDAVEPQDDLTGGLRRVLGPVDLTLLGIGAIVGAGIFALVGTAAAGRCDRPGAGPALIVSFVLTGLACTFTALCYAEFASLAPDLRQRLHLCLRHAGRAGGLDHRLGPDPGIRGGQHRRGRLLVGLFLRVPTHARHRVSAAGWPRDLRTALHTPEILRCCSAHVRRADRLQPARRVDRHGDHGSCWSGIRESAWFNAAMVAIKLVVLALLRGRRAVLRSAGELASLRAQRLGGDPGRGGGGVLRLHRLRRRFDRGRGVPQSETRPAHRHPRLAGDLHGDLRGGGRRAHRDDPLAAS